MFVFVRVDVRLTVSDFLPYVLYCSSLTIYGAFSIMAVKLL